MVKRPKQKVTQKVNKKIIRSAGHTVKTTQTASGQRSITASRPKHRRQDIDFDRTSPDGTVIRKIGGGASGRPALEEKQAQKELATRPPTERQKFEAAKENRIETPKSPVTTPQAPKEKGLITKVAEAGVAIPAKISEALGSPKGQAEAFASTTTGKVIGVAAAALQLTAITRGGIFLGRLIFGGASKASIASGSLIGKTVNVDKAAIKLGLTAKQTRGLAREISFRRVREAADLIQGKPALATKALSSGWKAKAIVGVGTLTVGGLLGASQIGGWAATDNIATGSTFTARLIREAAADGTITPEDALARFEELRGWNNKAEGFVTARNKVDPFAQGGLGKPYAIAIEKAQRDLDLNEDMFRSQYGLTVRG